MDVGDFSCGSRAKFYQVTAIVCDRGRLQRRLSHEAANGLDFGCNAPQHCDCIGRAFATRLMPLCVCRTFLVKEFKDIISQSTSPELLLNPVMADELENILTKKFFRILSMRADAFQVLRREPLQENVVLEIQAVSNFTLVNWQILFY
ncbi:hypothetical protein Patl1_26820 [Pistacia atlantica]|uniref:Uncharacterized protein n=1 Tax=Pistacia atlantica TaxID=434234 RepID=A0ACC1B190_9ROSI|nr:hypothetical protein Patl1_26820 [Pistacia atlantica]